METTPKPKKKKTVKYILLGVLAAGLIAAGIYILPPLLNPSSAFDMAEFAPAAQPTAVPTQAGPTRTPGIVNEKGYVNIDGTPVPTRTPMPTATPTEQELGGFGNVINIAILGQDSDNKSYAAGGGDQHTDGIVVASINFDTNEMNLISFPRDTFTKVPGHKGFYKLNCAYDVGGEGTEEGYLTTCETLSMFIGGVPVNYYFAVDMKLVVKLGNAIGGVDFDLPCNFRGPTSNRRYQKGPQHLDGMGIYEYMRARHSMPYPYNTDVSRTQRCREMLIACFNKLKTENLLTTVPDIISTVSNGLHTNITTRQMMALASYATRINVKKIGSYTFDGELICPHGWTFYFIKQQSRIDILKKVYGIDAAPIGWCSTSYETWLNQKGYLALKYLAQGEKTLAAFADAEMDEETRALYDETAAAQAALQNVFDVYSAFMEEMCETSPYSEEQNAYHKELKEALSSAEYTQKGLVTKLNKLLPAPLNLRFDFKRAHWYEDTDVNAVIVDMR